MKLLTFIICLAILGGLIGFVGFIIELTVKPLKKKAIKAYEAYQAARKGDDLELRSKLSQDNEVAQRAVYNREDMVGPFFGFAIGFIIVAGLCGLVKMGFDADYRLNVHSCQRFGKQTGYPVKMDRQDTATYVCYAQVNGQWVDKDNVQAVIQKP